MMIAGVVMILFILGLFFSMLGPQPRPDVEGQNDTEREHPSTVEPAEVSVPAGRL
jgi:hypothetical protein